MQELESGKLYFIYSTYKAEDDVAVSPFSDFVFATKDPYYDIENAGVTIENETLVVYLGQRLIPVMHFKMHPIFEEVVYFKLLVGDEILYVLDDGYACFKKAKHDTGIP